MTWRPAARIAAPCPRERIGHKFASYKKMLRSPRSLSAGFPSFKSIKGLRPGLDPAPRFPTILPHWPRRACWSSTVARGVPARCDGHCLVFHAMARLIRSTRQYSRMAVLPQPRRQPDADVRRGSGEKLNPLKTGRAGVLISLVKHRHWRLHVSPKLGHQPPSRDKAQTARVQQHDIRLFLGCARGNHLCNRSDHACPMVRNACVVEDRPCLTQRLRHHVVLVQTQGSKGMKRGRPIVLECLKHLHQLDFRYALLGV